MAEPEVPIRPAATVIVIRDRDGGGGIETLLLRRSADLAFHGGSWVFPGGRLDPEDYHPERPDDLDHAAANAAAREAHEEAGVRVDPASLLPFAHWTTPPGRSRRFATWFFVAPLLGEPAVFDVTVDGSEINDHLWVTPEEAIAAHATGEVELPAPTFVSLTRLAAYRDVAHAMASVPTEPYRSFTPRVVHVDGAWVVTLYNGDVAFEADPVDLHAPGPRHRIWLTELPWRYELEGL
ncbi:MAG: NUDIX domain-containing protein [Acidimicrobiales bacterium]|nr:NUDIX domain-containing protein [Acidimicrobiales bacterium]